MIVSPGREEEKSGKTAPTVDLIVQPNETKFSCYFAALIRMKNSLFLMDEIRINHWETKAFESQGLFTAWERGLYKATDCLLLNV